MATPARRAHRPARLSAKADLPRVKSKSNGAGANGQRAKNVSPRSSPAALTHELSTCATEADIVQVLYRGLHPVFGYDVVLLHVLEREGWYHSVPVDSGVLQDLRRRPLSDSVFAPNYAAQSAVVVSQMDPRLILQGTGPGAGRYVKFAIFVPVQHQGRLIGAVIYQSYRNRRVPASEISFLESIHRRLGVVLANASLNELTRNQARRLEALNAIGRAIAASLDEASILSSLRATLRELLPVDELKMVSLLPERSDRARLFHVQSEAAPTSRLIAMRAAQMAPPRQVISTAEAVITHEPESQLWVPLKEGGSVRGALGITSKESYAYEESTAAFLELVADEVTLALGNARSYEAIQEQRRRLELVNSIGRRLASSLDRWSIMRTLREELAAFLDFDGFILASITESQEGPVAEGYQYVAGVEEIVPPVALAVTGPSREAYESGRPVLVRNSPWASSFERGGLERERWTVGHGAAVFVSGPPGEQPHVSRSFVWVPVVSGDSITAMLSLQSYHEEAFSDWHVQLLQDLAPHVTLALANAEHFAQAQTERARLERLHVLELGVARASDERQLAEAIFDAAGRYIEASHMLLAYLDVAGNVVGFTGERDAPTGYLGPAALADAPFFRRLIETGGTVAEAHRATSCGCPSCRANASSAAWRRSAPTVGGSCSTI